MMIKKVKNAILFMAVVVLFACQQPGKNSTGSEYMPEMAHSIAYEANYYNYYYNNTWGSQDEYYQFAQPGLPVEGTVPRGYAGMSSENVHDHKSDNGVYVPANGSVPYYYGDTEEERTRATNEIVDNPFKITNDGLAVGKELYDIYCGICHGDKGDGAGYLVRDDGGKYLAQPANMLLPEFVSATNGRYYHVIMKGKNLMGAYKDKLSYEERWQVIHYIRSLQAKELQLTYDQYENTLNSVDVPAGDLAVDMEEEMHEAEAHEEDMGHDDHGDEHSDHSNH